MSITDKTRKLLWGRSGKRCAMCRQELIVDGTQTADDSIVGDECHIASGQAGGPRYNSKFPTQDVDGYRNLVLLCKVCHKRVDDQFETYTADILRTLKVNHEKWVAERLNAADGPSPIRFRKIKGGTPTHLARVTSGRELLALTSGTHAASLDHDELKTQEETDLVAGFLQDVQDWGDLDFEAGDRVRAAYALTQLLEELESAGFWVFGGKESKQIEGGYGPASIWTAAILRVVRSDSAEILHGSLARDREKA